MIVKRLCRLLPLALILISVNTYAGNGVQDNDFVLSELDNSLIQHENNPQITAVVPQSFPPFYFTDEDNLPYGMAIEVMNEIDHHAGYLTKYIVKPNWKEVFDSVEQGTAHIIPNLGITAERRKKYLFTIPYAITDINIFTRKHFTLTNKSKLNQIKTGVVEKNAGEKIAKEFNLSQVVTYPSIKDALLALTSKSIDAVIYPQIITIRDAKELNIIHLIKDTGITLKTIRRAIAVDKKHPEIHSRLNKALTEYIKTQNYTDTYSAWYGKEPYKIETRTLIIIDILLIISCLVFFIIFWKKKKLNLFTKDGSKRTDVIWIITLISILIATTLSSTIFVLSTLYNTAFDEQRHRLIDTTKSRARLIEAVARYDRKEYSKDKFTSGPTAYERTLSQVTSAHNKYRGFGDTGEFLLAKLNKETKEIQYLLRQRHSHQNIPSAIPFDSGLSVPMRLALLGHSGTIVAADYRGKQVLAAYEPVSVLKLGIVTKMDLEEIRKPFIDNALIIFAVVIVLSSAGAFLFFIIMAPIVNRLNYTEQRFHQLFRNTQTPAFLVNPKNMRIIDANNAATKFYGYTLSELSTYNLRIFYADDNGEMHQQIKDSLEGKKQIFSTQHRLQTGELRDVEVLTSTVDLDDETVLSFVITDVTEKLKQQREFQKVQKDLEQARKMEALGQLTGGIAHDFNNMLGVIMGYSSLSLDKIKNNNTDKVDEYLQQVLTASNRAKDLISSMMIFSRTGESKNQPMLLTPMVKENIKMMRSIIPTSVLIESHIASDLPTVVIEPVKLQQLIMNLCVNARDAMSGEGKLTIKLDWHNNVSDICQVCYEKITGDWIELSISDTGIGMSHQNAQRIFEPFFTTKEQGKGTGMGMSVVHGIVVELGGHALIKSAPGQGTTISILLPPAYEPEEKEIESELASVDALVDKNILIIDDEPSIAELLKSILESKGFHCKSFSSSTLALTHFENHANDYDLIISDQTMPEITGFQLVNEMRKTRADIPAIVSTGYSENFNESVAIKSNIVFLAKPVTRETLLSTVHSIFAPE